MQYLMLGDSCPSRVLKHHSLHPPSGCRQQRSQVFALVSSRNSLLVDRGQWVQHCTGSKSAAARLASAGAQPSPVDGETIGRLELCRAADKY